MPATRTTCAKLLPLLLLAGCGSPPAPPAEPQPLGSSKATAIEVCMPGGQREYLSRLRCSDGQAPSFRRAGNVGPRVAYPQPRAGETTEAYQERIAGSAPGRQGAPLRPGEADHHIVDLYELQCGATRHAVYLDMYHCPHQPPARAPEGFSLVPRPQGTGV